MKKYSIMLLCITVSAFAILVGMHHGWLYDKWDREQTYLFDNNAASYSPAIEIPKADLKYKINDSSSTLETGIVITENSKKNYNGRTNSVTNTTEESASNYQSQKIAKVDFQRNSYYQNQQPGKTEAKNTTVQNTGFTYKGISTTEENQFKNTNSSTFIADNTISTSTDFSAEENSPMLVSGDPGDPGVIPVGDGVPFLLALIALYFVRKVVENS